MDFEHQTRWADFQLLPHSLRIYRKYLLVIYLKTTAKLSNIVFGMKKQTLKFIKL